MATKMEKTYRAIRHDVVREKQKANCNTLHHPDEKINQINSVLEGRSDLKILDMFAGHGNCTKVYATFGKVFAFDKNNKVYESLLKNVEGLPVECKRTDSYTEVHNLLYNKKKFDVVDLDPYGFPNRLFPDIFLLIEDGFLFVTMPKPYVNILNGITAVHLISYYGQQNPKENDVIERIVLWGLCHWRKVTLLESLDCKSVWRFAFKVEKVKATEYTGVKNR